jgi:hypothetical protein
VLPADLASDPKTLSRLEREARAVAHNWITTQERVK